MYPYAAVILLPINSSLNPLLYSDAVDIAWNALSSCIARQPALKPLTDKIIQVLGSASVDIRNRPNQEIMIPDWLIASHVT